MDREAERVGAGDTEEIEKEKGREKERKKDKHKEIIKKNNKKK